MTTDRRLRPVGTAGTGAGALEAKAASFTPLARYVAAALAVLLALMPGQPRQART